MDVTETVGWSPAMERADAVVATAAAAATATAPATPMPASRAKAPAVKIGLISDIQYADVEDGSDFLGKEKRHHRHALDVTSRAVTSLNAEAVDFLVTLGDMIDGKNSSLGTTQASLRKVLLALSGSTATARFDLIGNHDLYNIVRANLSRSGLRCADPLGRTYYSCLLSRDWEAFFLDCYEHSLLGVPPGHPGYQAAEAVLKAENPTTLRGAGDWFSGLPTSKYRFVPYNGGMSPQQLKWLDSALAATCRAGRSALIFTHVALWEEASSSSTVIWNAEDALKVLHAYANCVVAVIAGHYHSGGYAVDTAGIHHVTMNAPLTAELGKDCWAVVDCLEPGRARFRAYGRACSVKDANTSGRFTGGFYPELDLRRGAENLPSAAASSAEDGVVSDQNVLASSNS